MKTMHVVKLGSMVLGMASLLALAPAHAQNEAPAPQVKAAPGSGGVAGGPVGLPGGTAKQVIPAGPTAKPTEDIRDIRGPRKIPDPWWWVLYAAGALLGLLLLYGVWRALGRKKLRVKLAHERAFEALERARTLMQPECAREFSYQLSDVVRQYIEERFAVRTTQQTTTEFLLYMSEQDVGPLSGRRGLLNEFLGNCDLVKFARWGLTESEMEAMFQSAWQFVDETKASSEGSPKAGFRLPFFGDRFPVSGVRRWPGGPETGNRTPETASGGPETGNRTPETGERQPLTAGGVS